MEWICMDVSFIFNIKSGIQVVELNESRETIHPKRPLDYLTGVFKMRK